MAIDRVGKGASEVELPKSSESGAARSGEPGKVFDAATERPEKGAEARASVPVGAAASPLEQLQAGQIDVDRYVNLKLDEATRHLSGLSASKMEVIRRVLRAQLATDPALVDLVRQATGSVASSPED